jgi:hypothetical protein
MYNPYADQNFPEKAKHEFYPRMWEMVVCWAFIQHGIRPDKERSEGPEFSFMVGGQKVWVEAIAPGPGMTIDAVPPLACITDPRDISIKEVPEEAIMLRLTGALHKKRGKYETDVQKGRIGAHDSYILALNGAQVIRGHAEGDLPYALKVALGIGNLTVSFDPVKNELKGVMRQRMTHITKRTESVPTSAFLMPEYSGITGLIYSGFDIFNVREPLSAGMFYVGNPLAANRLPDGALPFFVKH